MKFKDIYKKIVAHYPIEFVNKIYICFFIFIQFWLTLKFDILILFLICWGIIFIFFCTKLVYSEVTIVKCFKLVFQIALFLIPVGIYSKDFLILTIHGHSLQSILIGVLLGSISLLLSKQELKLALSDEILLIQINWSFSVGKDYLYLVHSIVLTIVEELFFRGMFYILVGEYVFIYFLFSTWWFVFFHHYTNISGTFSLSDYFRQMVISILSAALIVYTNSILGSIILHLFVNVATIIKYLKIIRFKKENENES